MKAAAQTNAKTQYRKIKTAASPIKHPQMTEKGRNRMAKIC